MKNMSLDVVVLRRFAYAILAVTVPALGCGFAIPTAGVTLSGGGGGGGSSSRSVQFELPTSVDLTNAEFIDVSNNIIGTPQIDPLSPNRYRVTMELDNVPVGEPIHFAFRSQVPVLDENGHDLTVANVQFYEVPPSQIPPGPGPSPPVAGPTFRWRIDTAMGIVLDIFNSNNGVPLNVHLQGAGSVVVLGDGEIYYDGAGASALVWQTLLSSTLGPLQAVTVDLPDDVGEIDGGPTGEPAAVLVRYLSSANGIEQKGIYQLDVIGEPIGVEETTWGAIKAMYRRDP